jgi:hypothetical protein
MYGVEHLSDYHTSEEILITDALSEQQQMGLAGDSPSFTGKVLDKVFQLGNTTAKFGDTIPLCVSEYIDLQRKDGFPCQCGSWNSNGTKIFMKKVGLTQHDPDWMSDPTKWTMKNVCPDVSFIDASFTKAVSDRFYTASPQSAPSSSIQAVL